MASSLLDVVSSGPKTRKLSHIALHHVPQELAQRTGVFRQGGSRLVDVESVFAKIGQPQCLLQDAAIGVRIGAHAARAGRRQRFQFGDQGAVGIEQLFRLLRSHPVFQSAKLLRIFLHIRQRNLMSAPESFQPMTFDFFGSRSSLWANVTRSSASAAGWAAWRKPSGGHRSYTD